MPPRAHVTDPAKLLPPILRLLEQIPPDAYSAQQKARTTAARLLASAHYDSTIEVLFGSAKELLKLREWGSGCDLAVYLVQAYEKGEIEVTDESKGMQGSEVVTIILIPGKARLMQLLALIDGEGPWRKKVADAAIKWSSDLGDCPTGDPDMHKHLGELYYKDRQFPQAEHHLLASCKRDAASMLADMMFEWSDKGARDPGAFACRVILPYLSLTPPAILPAKTFMNRYLSLLSAHNPAFITSNLTAPESSTSTPFEVSLTVSPSLNFLQLAILTVQRAPAEGVSGVQARGTTGGVGKEWESLVRRYKGMGPLLNDEAVQEALLHISTTAFKIPPPRPTGGNDMLQNLMGSLFGGGAPPLRR
ncbi:hypothetical protein QFC20_006426 [Naganishia adeliensis]|uniref:Uncharacterized protein n=1 Tax=Naganishia adeliensis TaxID=92952 RepID=A0ACC2VBN5_9TREE|nr:hypothetical protein QFC20_006426 [Naganishia adeliensis]